MGKNSGVKSEFSEKFSSRERLQLPDESTCVQVNFDIAFFFHMHEDEPGFCKFSSS